MNVAKGMTARLDAGAVFDCEYRGGLSNHRPMALLALARLGASDARLSEFDARYSQRLQAALPASEWPAGDAWASRLGQRDAWPIYRHMFWHWLASEDAGDVLKQVLPLLMRGCGAAAFHGLIRTAYAVQAQHHQELADALAYWACRWLDLGEPTQGNEPDPEAVLRRLPLVDSNAGLVMHRMRVAAADPRFAASAGHLRVHALTLPRLSVLAAKAYGASGSFTALHLLTSGHALRVLLGFIEEPDAAVAAYARAFNAAVCVAGLRVLPPVPPLPWNTIVARACASDDDHVAKLVDSAREQHAALGGSVWQAAASRAVATA